jgi:hypothetical protein
VTPTTTTMNKMATVNAAQQSKKEIQKPRWKWSGDDEPSRNDDTDGITLRKDVKWYDVHNHDGHDWNNADD